MKYYKTKLLFLLLILFGSFGKIISQCDQTQTISVCDMSTIDFDMDGTPDGIVNLYTETGTTPADGTWSTLASLSVALDETTGDLLTWELRTSSINNETYQFILSNATCADDPALTVILILGAYSGTALPPDDDDINYYICEDDPIPLDLDTVLVTNSITPGAHINGNWMFTGTNPGGATLDGSLFTGGEVPYQPGLPRVDQNVYEISYVVPGVAPCSVSVQTTIKVSVVRQVDAGIPDSQVICESSILAGDWDNDINVRDFLNGEDIEGFWVEEQNGTPENLIINIRDLYNEITANGANPRFGCESYNFGYIVEKRSVVCSDASSIVNFRIFEELRNFQQSEFPVVCPGKVEDPPTIINLFDLLEFTPGFEYKSNILTHWEFISGPSDLGLVSKRPDGGDPTALRCVEDPAISNPDLFPPYYDANGPVNINGARPGIYRFRYYVCADIVGCGGNICPDLETEVVIEILAEDHAGEDTLGLNFCLDQGSVDLRSLLLTNGIDDVVETGVWTDLDGNEVPNLFVFPTTLEPSPQEFTFTYSTISADNCLDSADITFNIYENANAGAGTGMPVTLCSDNLTVTLFDLLEGDPDTTGIWTGPFGYTSTDHLGVFDASNPMLPVIGSGDYVYTVLGNVACTDTAEATVTISIVDPIEVGSDRFGTFCKIDGRVNLFSLLDNDTPLNGQFEDTDPPTNALSDEGVLEFETLANGIYDFRYFITGIAPCDERSLTVSIQIVELPEPNVPDQEFCILDAKRLDDIVVDVLNYNWYASLESDMPLIDNPLLFDNQIYYIATVDADNCESERIAVSIDILNMGERFSDGAICTLDFQDGVSPDGNNQNDTFELFIEDKFNIPIAFPDFSLIIFNRYGAKVFEGNRNTEEFRGESNVSIRLGDDLPSGNYFYIFTPNFENNFPIQGSFYLSR